MDNPLDQIEIPLWRSDGDDQVRVVVGSFEGVSSPLAPIEPFTFLDVQLRREMSLVVREGHEALVYVLEGSVVLHAVARELSIHGGQALAIGGSGERASFEASEPTHFVDFAREHGSAIRPLPLGHESAGGR